MIHGLTKRGIGVWKPALRHLFGKQRAAVYAESRRFQVDTPLHASGPSIFYPVELIAGGEAKRTKIDRVADIAGIKKEKR